MDCSHRQDSFYPLFPLLRQPVRAKQRPRIHNCFYHISREATTPRRTTDRQPTSAEKAPENRHRHTPRFTSRRIAPGHRQIREMQQPPITATVDPKKFPTPYTTVITSPRTIETNCQNGTGKTIFGHDSNSMGMMMLHPHQR